MSFTFAKAAKTGVAGASTLSTAAVTSSGNFLIAAGNFSFASALNAPTDNLGNTWAQLSISPKGFQSNAAKIVGYVAHNATTGAGHQLTWSLSAGSDNYSIVLLGLSGRATSSAVENGVASAETVATTTHSGTATGTIPQAGDDAIVIFGDNNFLTVNSNDTWTAGSGLTLDVNAFISDGRDQLTCGIMYAASVSTTGITPAYGSTASTIAAFLAFAVKAAAGVGDTLMGQACL